MFFILIIILFIQNTSPLKLEKQNTIGNGKTDLHIALIISIHSQKIRKVNDTGSWNNIKITKDYMPQ